MDDKAKMMVEAMSKKAVLIDSSTIIQIVIGVREGRKRNGRSIYLLWTCKGYDIE